MKNQPIQYDTTPLSVVPPAHPVPGLLYETLINSLSTGVIMMDAHGRISASNKAGAAILGLSEENIVGRKVASSDWQAVHEDGSPFHPEQFPAVQCLRTGKPQRDIVMGLKRPDEQDVWLSVNAEALSEPGAETPYAAVISFTDITGSMQSLRDLRASNERLFLITQVTSDAIWDVDLQTNAVYRSDAFYQLSGYTKAELDGLDGWFSFVHPEDRDRVETKLNLMIRLGEESWEDEYRFRCANGQYKYLHDSGLIVYRNGVARRIVGAIRDLSLQKKLEEELRKEQEERNRAIARASIRGQEAVKANISQELHDNVNQILMSAKLFMENALRITDQRDELIHKAIEYQLLALHEIRKLSKTHSQSYLHAAGLYHSIQDLVENLRLHPELRLTLRFAHGLEEKLNDEIKLNCFRLIQEQTNNIVKYAGQAEVLIAFDISGNLLHLRVYDTGNGFDMKNYPLNGIGFMNMNTRVESMGGRLEIQSAEGKGCQLDAFIPIPS